MEKSVPVCAKRLLDFIRSYEAPRGYDTVFGNKMFRMPKPVTSMTVNEVIADGPRRTREFGSSAAGGLQFMTATLKGLRDGGLVVGSERMTPEVQDRLGYELLKRRGYDKFMSGAMTIAAFGNQIAMEWASFPVLAATNGKRRGQSYYAGDGLNHVLVGPEPVEKVLRSMRPSPGLSFASLSDTSAINAEAAIVERPRAATVPMEDVASTGLLGWWKRFRGKAKAAGPASVARPGLHPNGDPSLWDVQAALKSKGYYQTGLLDGLDGGRTQGAVAQSRKDNGLGDGGIDPAFMAAYPFFPQRPVSKERANLPLTKAAEHAPELFKPPAWLVSAGLGSLGLGGASGAGLMDQVQQGVGTATDVFGQMQSAFGIASGIVSFIVEYRTYFLVGVGLLLVWKGVSAILSAWVKVKQAFF